MLFDGHGYLFVNWSQERHDNRSLAYHLEIARLAEEMLILVAFLSTRIDISPAIGAFKAHVLGPP